jgi:hypothetical protein
MLLFSMCYQALTAEIIQELLRPLNGLVTRSWVILVNPLPAKNVLIDDSGCDCSSLSNYRNETLRKLNKKKLAAFLLLEGHRQCVVIVCAQDLRGHKPPEYVFSPITI